MATGDTQRKPRDYFYGEVLGLPPGTRRPDHYSMLGVPYFESDRGVVLRAALDRIRLLEACQVDARPAYRKVARQLLREVQNARITLLDPVRRREYDAALMGRDPAEAREQEDDREVELRPGAMLQDRYRVMREARSGALGIVYEAMDRNLRSKVHVSVLRPRLSRDREARRAVERAARTAATLDHGGLLRVDEVASANGLLFVRTRSMEGRSLLETIEASPHMRLEDDEARRIATEVAATLQAVHEQGACHGDLRPHNVFLDRNGRVLVADACISRAVADAGKGDEPTPADDVFALGRLLFQMLAGMPPKTPDGTARPLPDGVADDLAAAVRRMLAPRGEGRPATAAEALDLLRPRAKTRRPVLLAGAAVLVVLALGLYFLLLGGNGEAQPDTVEATAWRLIAEEDYHGALEVLEPEADDPALRAPLLKALEGAAAKSEREGNPADAQLWLTQAAALDSSYRPELERVRAKAVARLESIPVTVAEVSAAPEVRIDAAAIPFRSATVGGKEFRAAPFLIVPLDRPDGRYEVDYALEDSVGNRHEGTLTFVVDTVPPAIEIVEPVEGAGLRDGSVSVRVRVEDENPEPAVVIRGRKVALVDGAAIDTFDLGDGEHVIDVLARDRAGHEARAERRVLVDTRRPDIGLDEARVVTRSGRARIAGTLRSPIRRLAVDGREVTLGEDGRFEATVQVAADRLVPVEATSLTGLSDKRSVRVVVDRDPPELRLAFDRRAKDGTLLFGTTELDAGFVSVRVKAGDKTKISFAPQVGSVEAGVWKIPAVEGTRGVVLSARDEAGNEREVGLELEGRRATPRLVVKEILPEVTNDDETTLEIEADGRVELQGREVEPGRHELALPEGRFRLDVVARDRWGNESRWTKEVLVDRTPPTLELEGGLERGIGLQEIRFRASEPIESLTCFGKTFEANRERVAPVVAKLKEGKRRLHVVARDLAGNTGKAAFDLVVRNRVLLLDGRSAVRVDLPKDLDLEEFTVECWVRGMAPDRTRVVLGNYDDAGFALVWSGGKDGFPYALFHDETNGGQTIPVRKAWKWEEWTHLALSFDGKRARFYVDGSLQGFRDLEPVHSKAPFYVGGGVGRRGPENRFEGAVDEVRISRVARYTRGFSPPRYLEQDDRTVLLLRFDGLERGLHPDVSGRALHGRPVGDVRLVQESR